MDSKLTISMVMSRVKMVMTWSVAEAKAKFSEVLDRAREEPQFVESRGRPKAVVVSAEDFARLKALEAQSRRPGLLDFLAQCEALREEGPLDLEPPARAIETERQPPFSDD